MNKTEEIINTRKKKDKVRKVVRKIIFTVVFVVLVAAFLYCYNFKLKNDRWPWQKEVVASPLDSMTQTKVYKSTYTTEIDISGYVQAYDTQEVVIRAEGAVTGVYVKEGDRVKKGDLLAEIDCTNQKYNVASIENQIEKAEIGKTTSQKEIELLKLKLESAKQQLENTKAYANFDGVVVSVSIEEGDYFTAGSSVMTIIDDSKLKATVEVDEIDIQMVSEGMKCTLTSDSSTGETIEAYISYIPMIGRYSSSGIGVMDVEIVIDNPPSTLKPGFSFEGVIDVESEQELLLVSQSAVTTRRGISSVQKLKADGTVETVQLTVKYLGENLYQILAGDIQEGDTVVYSKTSTSGLEGLMGSMGGMMGGGDMPDMGGGPNMGGGPR